MRSPDSSPLRPALYEGAFWLVLGSGGQKLLGLLSGIALARLLSPDQFGVFAMAALAYELAVIFDGMGTAQYVVADRSEAPRLDAAHRINLLVAAGLALVLAALAFPVARFFGEPMLGKLIPVLAAALPLGAWGAVNGALLERELRLGALARRRLMVNSGAVVLMVALAAAGFGVWALIVPVPLRSAANSLVNRRLHPWRPSRGGTGAGEVIAYGRHILGARLAHYVFSQMDNLAVGRFLGTASLGVYDFAYQAAMMPLRFAGDLATRLSFPALAAAARGRPDARDPEAFLRASRWMAYAAGPLVAGLVVVAGDWVHLLYGERWAATIPLIRVLAPMALPLLLARPVTAWLQASGFEAWPARIQLAGLPLVALGLWIGVPRGILAVAAAMAVVLALESAATIGAALRAGAAPARAWLGAVWSGLLPSVIMVAGLWPASLWARGLEPVALRLALLIPSAVALFAAASALTARDHLVELRDLTRHALRGLR